MRNWLATYSGGVNTTAMIVKLVEDGWHGVVAFVDTGGEHPETYCYIDYFEREFLRPNGLELVRISPKTHLELYSPKIQKSGAISLEEYCLKMGVIPILAARWCSVEFKRVPVENFRKKLGLDGTLIGMTVDEPHRIRRDDPTVRYPLVEHLVNREECRRIIHRAGLELPRKSGCFFCPGASLADLQRLWHDHPDLYGRAVALEENASKRAGRVITLDPKGIPLSEKARRRWQGLTEFDLSRWMPCACAI